MLVSWAHTYGKHDVGALIGYEESRNWGDEVDICKEGMSSVNLTDFDAMTDPYYIKGSSYEYSSRSWFGRINYAFDNRYLFGMMVLLVFLPILVGVCFLLSLPVGVYLKRNS